MFKRSDWNAEKPLLCDTIGCMDDLRDNYSYANMELDKLL